MTVADGEELIKILTGANGPTGFSWPHANALISKIETGSTIELDAFRAAGPIGSPVGAIMAVADAAASRVTKIEAAIATDRQAYGVDNPAAVAALNEERAISIQVSSWADRLQEARRKLTVADYQQINEAFRAYRSPMGTDVTAAATAMEALVTSIVARP